MLKTFVAGGVDSKKHVSILEAAQHELSEEARLCGGKWIPLLPEGHPGVSELKWGRNRFFPFLCIDPVLDPNPRARDLEEKIDVLSNVSLKEFKDMVLQGTVMLPAVQTSIMALDWLQQNGYLDKSSDATLL